METLKSILNYAIPITIIILSLVIGFLVQKYILYKLIRRSKHSKVKIDDLIFTSFKGVIILLFVTLGVYIVANNFAISDKLLTILNKTALTLLIFSFTLVVANFLGGFIQLYTEAFSDTFFPASLIIYITKIIVIAIGILIILQKLGISIAPLLTALGVSGLAVALALQDTLSNFFAGITILLGGQLHIGDYIKIESGEEGYIEDMTWRNTTIRKLPDNLIVIPNSKLANSLVINYSLPRRELNVIVEVGVSYDSDLEKVEKVTIEVARDIMKNVEGGVPEFEPFIRYIKFDNSSINFRVIMRAKSFVDRFKVVHEFIKKLHKRYQKENIEIPFPITTVYLRNNVNKG